jgi:hypothetical protein
LLKRRWAILSAVCITVAITACSHAANETFVPSGTSAARAPSGTTMIVVALPPIATTTSAPSPGIVGLSFATRSIAGTVGKKKIAPIVLNSTTPGCTASAGALNCTIAVAAGPGKHKLKLSSYATTDGTGAALAQTSASVTVSRGLKNYPPALTWTGIATKLTLLTTPSTLTQGQAAEVQVVAYGVDAGGAPIPDSNVVGPDGSPVSASIVATGPYQVTNACFSGSSLDSPCNSLTYDGIKSGIEKLTATSGEFPPAKRKLVIKPGPTGAAQIVTESELTDVLQDTLQFSASASGNASPLRMLLVSGVPYGLGVAGDFWIGGTHYAANGATLGQIAPLKSYTIAGGAIDRSGNVYLAENEISAYSDETLARQVNEYAAGSYRLLRSIVPVFSAGQDTITAITVDGLGNLFVGAAVGNFHASAIYKYAPGTAGSAPPTETITVSNAYPAQIAADATGNLFVPISGTSVMKYAPGSNTGTAVLSNPAIEGFAIDGSGDIYIAAILLTNDTISIQEFAPGSTTPMRTIAGPLTLLNCCDWQDALTVAQ